MVKAFVSHIFVFLLGLLAAGLYYRALVHPSLSQRLQLICDQGQLGYPGDWVLNIFFSVIPLTIVAGLVLTAISIRKK